MTRPAEQAPDPYKVLRIDPEADDEIIQVVYRRLARKYHPDVTPGPAAAARMIELNAAMEILGNPERRAAYDRAREWREASAARSERTEAEAAAASGAAAPTRWSGGRGSAARPEGGGAARDDGPAGRGGPAGGPASAPPPQTVSREWTTGRSTVGGVYDPSKMRTPDGDGAAGPPPGSPSGTVLNFGRYSGWSLGEVARRDLEYLEWLDRMTIGRTYRDEVDALLRQAGRRRSAPVDPARRGLFRRR
jgi:curved DNA-binding protein CbpA